MAGISLWQILIVLAIALVILRTRNQGRHWAQLNEMLKNRRAESATQAPRTERYWFGGRVPQRYLVWALVLVVIVLNVIAVWRVRSF